LDTQGGDRPPAVIITGGLKAAEDFDVEVIFAGDRAVIEGEMSRRAKKRHTIIHAPQIVTMEDAPAEAVRQKPESSLVRGVEYLRHGEAHAFVSPANTGAVMAAALLKLGRLRGIDRPGIGAIIPTTKGKHVLVIDVGANVDCAPENLRQFALMGCIYAREILGVVQPRVGLLNIGSERRKGNALALKSFFLLEQLGNFTGNVEGNQILEGAVDVVVCDGFVGNVLLKAYEGGTAATLKFLGQAITKDFFAQFGSFILLPALRNFRRSLSASRFGGAPLLGVRGVVIIAHGNSDAEAIRNAIRVAADSIRHQLIDKIEQGLQAYNASAGEASRVKEVTP
jgi:glycerol-3-phosphate acyltransferase PlsX